MNLKQKCSWLLSGRRSFSDYCVLYQRIVDVDGWMPMYDERAVLVHATDEIHTYRVNDING